MKGSRLHDVLIEFRLIADRDAAARRGALIRVNAHLGVE